MAIRPYLQSSEWRRAETCLSIEVRSSTREPQFRQRIRVRKYGFMMSTRYVALWWTCDVQFVDTGVASVNV